MPYRIRLSDEAKGDVLGLSGQVRQRVRRLIAALEGEPRPLGAKEVRDRSGVYRLRLERWRIIYRALDDDLLVIVFAVRRKTGPSQFLRMRRSGPETYDDIE